MFMGRHAVAGQDCIGRTRNASPYAGSQWFFASNPTSRLNGGAGFPLGMGNTHRNSPVGAREGRDVVPSDWNFGYRGFRRQFPTGDPHILTGHRNCLFRWALAPWELRKSGTTQVPSAEWRVFSPQVPVAGRLVLGR